MSWWMWILLLVYACACGFLIFVILIQSGKGGGLSSLAGASQGISDALGATGAEKTLNKLTTFSAVGFMVLAIILSIGATQQVRRQERILGVDAVPPAVPLSDQPEGALPPAGAPSIQLEEIPAAGEGAPDAGTLPPPKVTFIPSGENSEPPTIEVPESAREEAAPAPAAEGPAAEAPATP